MRLLLALLIVGALANDADKYCPSSLCWDYITDPQNSAKKICSLKIHATVANQAHCATLTCDATEMKVDYSENLFGSDWKLADFKEPTYTDSTNGNAVNCLEKPNTVPGAEYNWASPLGECGMDVQRSTIDT